jgi:hypothetical protein
MADDGARASGDLDPGATHQCPRRRWISPAGWVIGSLLVGFVLVYALADQVLTDRLTVHNRTTVAVSFTTDAFGGLKNAVGQCSSEEFAWRQEGSKAGWRPVGPRELHGGSVGIDLAVERPIDGIGARHFEFLVTTEGVVEMESDITVPACEGVPPE